MSNNIKFLKMYPVKSPSRGTPHSAGIDFYVPDSSSPFRVSFLEKNPRFWSNNGKHSESGHLGDKKIFIAPHESVLIPSGIKVKFDENFVFIAFNKSGVAVKKGLDVGACVIDADYQGVIHFNLTNTTDHEVEIELGEKILQFVLLPVAYAGVQEMSSELEMYEVVSVRGEGGFGHTGVR